MNKLKLLTFFLLAAFFIQSCKKDTIVGTAYTTAPFQANINGATWAPDTTTSSVTYNAATGIKTFMISGTHQAKQIILSIGVTAGNTPGFPLGTYNVDASAITAQYNVQEKNSSGEYVFVPHGAVGAGSGIFNITAVDSVKKQITGTFQFYSRSTGTDGSVTVDNILGGEFTTFPYTYQSN